MPMTTFFLADALSIAITWTGAAVLIIGGFVGVIGGVGLVRLPDFYTRIHAGGVTDTLATGLILMGLMFQAGWSLILVKLVMILVFLWITSPTGCHALAQSAKVNGLTAWEGLKTDWPRDSGDSRGNDLSGRER